MPISATVILLRFIISYMNYFSFINVYVLNSTKDIQSSDGHTTVNNYSSININKGSKISTNTLVHTQSPSEDLTEFLALLYKGRNFGSERKQFPLQSFQESGNISV